MKKTCLTLVVLFSCFIYSLHSDDCFSEYWQRLFWTHWENESFGIGTFAKIETRNHLKNIRTIHLTEQLWWKWSKNFSFELHYTYVHSRSIIPKSPWIWQQRLELEANPVFHLSNNGLLITRNRLEIRKLQHEPKILYRLRQLTLFNFPFKNMGRLKSFSVYNEIFYDISTHFFTEDRIYPFQLTFAISDIMDLDVFFMMRFFNTNDIWWKSAVLGTQINF